MPSTIDISKLTVIPYLDLTNLHGRSIPSLMFRDGEKWRTWLGTEGGDLIEVSAWPAEAFYFAKDGDKADPDDMVFRFIDFIAQRACFPEVVPAFLAIHDDIFNLSASLAKIEHLHVTRAAIGLGVHRMVAGEVEHVFNVCRSVFDLLQEVIERLWDTILLVDQSIKKRSMKGSFNDITHFKGAPASRDHLMTKFGLPQGLADFYVAWTPFFDKLRQFRDAVVHRGSQVQLIFVNDDGFMISKTLRPFNDMDVWRESERRENDLVPLMPALGVMVLRTLGACEAFSVEMSKAIVFPPEVAPGMHLFMRSYFSKTFVRIINDSYERLGVSGATKEEAPLAEAPDAAAIEGQRG